MNLLQDIITYVRRIIKSPSNADISDGLIIDYINRFWIMDVDARIQLFDLKTKYQFQTSPGVDQYNMPLYSSQIAPFPSTVDSQTIEKFPVYQGFLSPAYINGVQVPLQTQKNSFFNIWPNVVQNSFTNAVGDGTTGPYTINIPLAPGNSTPLINPVNAILRGHVDITGLMGVTGNQDPITGVELNLTVPTTSVYSAVYFTATNSDGSNIVVCDSGQFLTGNMNYGLLMTPGAAPRGNATLVNGGGLINTYATTQNTINYFTGVATNVYFPTAIPAGVPIGAQYYYFQTGLPRSILYYNNIITLRSPPDRQYLVELDAYLSPAAFLNTEGAIPFGYMAEYIARGAARKILSDTGDVEQFNFYEPLFQEQELRVWKRSQRQWTNDRTQTIYSQGLNMGQSGFNNIGGSSI